MVITCNGCNKTFKHSHGLSRHRTLCLAAKEHTAFLAQKRLSLQKVGSSSRKALRNAEGNEELQEVAEDLSSMDVDMELNHEPERQPSPQFVPAPATSGLPHLPERIFACAPSPLPAEPRSPSPPQLEAVEPEPQCITTKPDEFGLYRVYETYPSHVPDENQGLDDCCNAPGLAAVPNTSARRWWAGFGAKILNLSPQELHKNIFAPFLNATVFRLMNWFYSGSMMKSVTELQSLVDNVLLADDYDHAHLQNFIPTHSHLHMKTTEQSTVRLKLPAERVNQTEESAPELEVPSVCHCSLLEVFTTALQDTNAKSFHYTPFSLFWKPTPESIPERVYSELYNSDVFLKEHHNIQQLPPEPGPQYECAIAAGMLWSNSTHLANFGTQSLWPGYIFFGNQSKYACGKPSQFAAHHLAYIPSFIDAYEHGIVFKCADGVIRRIYPCFFTYAADYPEKVLLSTIRYLANCPCPRCFIQKSHIKDIGSHVDDQRRTHIRADTDQRQDKVNASRSQSVNDILQDDPYNAFSTRLYPFGFNFFSLFVPDLLHEFELGVWKAIFTHLLRILYTAGDNCIQSLNWRYCHVPTFGRGTIRRFHNNASAMKKLAGRDFEDLLQCSLPVFEHLLPEPHNKINTTKELGKQICYWVKKMCSVFETPAAASKPNSSAKGKSTTLAPERGTTRGCGRGRGRPAGPLKGRSAGGSSKVPKASTSKEKGSRTSGKGKNEAQASKLRKFFNLCTYKLHALGDYVAAIARYGTTDNYSTQVGELEHRRVKRFYARTNKNKAFTRQITRQQWRECILRNIRERLKQPPPPVHSEEIQSPSASVPFEESDALPPTTPEVHHHLSNSTRQRENIFKWVDYHERNGDQAVKDFIPNLKDHILSRLLERPYDGDEVEYTEDDRDTVVICTNSIYQHKVLRVNYTTYDLRRLQDSINPCTHPDIMLLSHDNEQHPYWYARVIGIFHVDVIHTGPLLKSPYKQCVDFLWIRWFGRDLDHRAGWLAQRLHRVGFLDAEQPGAFGIHLIPGFAYGTSTELLSPPQSVARLPLNEVQNWRYYYVGMFVDHDMVMRFMGGGVGHKATNAFTQAFAREAQNLSTNPEVDDDSLNSLDENYGDDLEDSAGDAEEDDYGYVIDSEVEESNGEDREEDEDIGGEEPWEMDDVQAEGFDDL
ncbi:hypothetical protein BYT27DRAFT_7185715 [Phlegmacium glaucopus]|nr:hypothetical protein BYT27DRAFT_7185715 [Phlegmacium glaucopus]